MPNLIAFQQRDDLTPEVVHFTKGTPAAAFNILRQILEERQLRGGTGFIKGAHTCVCFTEAPLLQLCEVFWRVATSSDLRYQPYGILVPKGWLFERGGRPVIYETDAEYEQLPTSFRYRHVRYEPNAQPPIDFAWEREWRVPTTALPLDSSVIRVVVPTLDHIKRLHDAHDSEQDRLVRVYSQALGQQLAEQMREPYPWTCIALEQLRPDWEIDPTNAEVLAYTRMTRDE